MIKEFWHGAKEQLADIVHDWFYNGYRPDGLIELINNNTHWDKKDPFANERLYYADAELTLSQWITVVEATAGQEASYAFKNSLEYLIKSTILYQWDVRTIEGQEEFNYVHSEVA